MRKKVTLFASSILSAALLAATNSWAGDMNTYEVTLYNLTPGQPIAPVMVATHRSGMSFFHVGEAPSLELASLAEAGNGNPMAEKLRGLPGVSAAEVGMGLTFPGHSATIMITAREGDNLSLGAMLGATNDAFVALTDVLLPKGKQMVTYMAPAYDAGSETNDELCATVPGCGGAAAALSPDDSGEGFVHIHSGIHGVGDLNAAEFDWRNPSAKVVIKLIK